MSESKQIIISKGTSGLGNRILASCTAILYAEIVGAQVYIDWTEGNYSDRGINSFHQFFECLSPAFIAELPSEVLENPSIYPAKWRGKLDFSFGELLQQPDVTEEKLTFDVSRSNFKEDILVFCAYTHKIHKMRHLFSGDYSFLQKLNNAEILRILLDKFFVLKNPVKDLVETYKQEQFTPSTIGVHVRYTDMKISVDDIIKSVRKIMGKDSDRQIFLATDSQDIIQRFKATFPNTITTQKWLPESGGRLHLVSDRDNYQIGVEALRDLYLLTECPSLVYSSQSSFGRVAALLSQAQPNAIYDIERPSLSVRMKNKIKAGMKRLLGRMS